jgi:hypothetical protein
MDDERFHNVGGWLGGIVLALVVEAIIVRVAQRCMPGLFPGQQPQKPQQPARRR